MPYWIFHFFSLNFVSFRSVSLRFVLFDFVSVFFRCISFRFVTFRFLSFRSVMFRFVWFRFVSFGFVSFRFYLVSHFTCTRFIQRISWYINCRYLQAGVLCIFIMITNYSEISDVSIKHNNDHDIFYLTWPYVMQRIIQLIDWLVLSANFSRGRHDRDRMVVGFTTIYENSTYHH